MCGERADRTLIGIERRSIMPIEFFCPGCGKPMRTADSHAERKGKCPECGTKVQIPSQSIRAKPIQPPSLNQPLGQVAPQPPAPAQGIPSPTKGFRLPVTEPNAAPIPRSTTPATDAKPPLTSAAAETGRSTPKRIRLHCPRCLQRLVVPQSASGRQGQCPRCGTLIPIPAR